MEPGIEEIDEMIIEGAGGGSHYKEYKQDTKESSVSAEGIDDGMTDASNCIENKESNDELGNRAFAEYNTNVDSTEYVRDIDNPEKETLNDEHDKEEQLTVSVDMQNSGAGLAGEDDVTDSVTLNAKEEITNDDMNIAKEVLQVPEKKVLKRKKAVKKIVKKRRLVKGKFTAKDEEEPQSSEMSDPSVQVPTDQDVKNTVDMQKKGAGLASDEGVNEMFTFSDEDSREETVIGNLSNEDTREAKDLEFLTDAITSNAKEEITNDDTNTAKEVLLVPEQKVLKRKKVVKKIVKRRRLVKGKVTTKDEEGPQSSEMHAPSVQVPTIQNVKNRVDVQNKGEGLAGDEVVNEMFTFSEEDSKEETVIRNSSNQDAREAKDLESLTDAVTLNAKEETANDTNTTNEVLLVPEKKVLKPKKVIRKVVKKRTLVKGKVGAKDGEEPQTSEMSGPYVEVQSNQNLKNKAILDEVAIKSKQSEKNKQAGKEKAVSESKNVGDMKEEAKNKLSKISSRKAEPSEKQKSSNKVETVGMIFMCSSKTKEDCYRYKVFGLPESKKDVVLEVYDGMKLFLFDFKLKLLYGIYKAAGPGGYNIEPNAFHSNFPSQVRFSIVDDCNPLPEAKFKKVIKDNYYTKNKFSAELNSKQVNSLCELFLASKNGTMSKAKAVMERPKVGIRPIVEREKKRKARVENEVDQGNKKRRVVVDIEKDFKRRRVVDDVKHSRGKDNVIRPRVNVDVRRPRVVDVRRPTVDVRRPRVENDARRSRANDDARRSRANDDARRSRANEDARRWRLEGEERRLRLEGEERRLRLDGAIRLQLEDDARYLRAENDARLLRDEEDARGLLADDRRHSPRSRNDSYPHLADVYQREAYLPSALSAPLHLDALPPLSYAYGRTSLLDDYRPDVTIGHEDRGLASSGLQPLYEYESRDRYLPYREPIEYRHREYATRDEYLPSTSSMYRRY